MAGQRSSRRPTAPDRRLGRAPRRVLRRPGEPARQSDGPPGRSQPRPAIEPPTDVAPPSCARRRPSPAGRRQLLAVDAASRCAESSEPVGEASGPVRHELPLSPRPRRRTRSAARAVGPAAAAARRPGWPTASSPPIERASWPTTCGRRRRRPRRAATLPAGLCAASWPRTSASTRCVDTDITPADNGLTQKALHRLDDGRLDRVGADALPGARLATRAGHGVHLEPGGLRGRLPVLRDRRAGFRARPRYAPRSSTRSASGGVAGRRRASALTNVVFMGMGEPLLNADRVMARRGGDHRSASASAWARATSRSARAACVPGMERLIEPSDRSTRWRSLCTPHGRSCAMSWCRSTGAIPVDEVVDAATATRTPPAAA